MADQRLTQLPTLITPSAEDLLYIVDNPAGTPASRAVRVDAVLALSVPSGGTTGQILTKTSAADYATAWQTPTTPILANNSFLQGYRADGTTAQNLIGIIAANVIHVAPNAPYVLFFGDQAQADMYIGNGAQGNINIGSSLAAGKNIYVPRLAVQGILTLQDQVYVNSSTGQQILLPYSPTGNVFFAVDCNANFNNNSGTTTFIRDVEIAGVLRKGGVAYTHPDFVFEHHYTGHVEQFAEAPGAKDYEGLLPLADVETYTREHWHLPHQAHDSKYDLFRRGDEVLAEVERTMLYLFDHERRLKALEAISAHR